MCDSFRRWLSARAFARSVLSEIETAAIVSPIEFDSSRVVVDFSENLGIRGSLMPSFKPTDLWNAEPHTLAKIEIVRRYLFLWFRILGTSSNRLVYIDGFSGPGRYLNSDQSSPIAALTGAKEAFDKLVDAQRAPTEWFFYFIDENTRFTSSLESVISETEWPRQFKCEVQTGTFEEKLRHP